MVHATDAPSDHEFSLGAAVLDLFVDARSWIARRIEQVEWKDDRTILRTTTYDLSFEAYGEAFTPPKSGNRVLLPLTGHPRRPSRNVTLTTASGEPLPHLTRGEERRLVAAGLTILGRDTGEDVFGDIPDKIKLLVILEKIDEEMADNLPAEWQRHDRQKKIEEYLEATEDTWLPFARDRLVIALPPSNDLTQKSRIRLVEFHQEEFPRSLRPSHRKPLFSLRSALAYEQHAARKIVKARDGIVNRFMPGEDGAPEPIWRRRWHRDDAPVTLPASAVGESASFHLEIRCPQGLFFESPRLVVTRQKGLSDDSNELTKSKASASERRKPSYDIVEIHDDDQSWEAAHFYYGSPRNNSDDHIPEVLESAAALILRPMYHGVLRSGVNLSVVTTMILFALTATIGWMAAKFPVLVHAPFDSRDTNSVVSVILLANTVALGALIRQDEHLLTKWVLDPYRKRLALLALVSFTVALMLAIGLAGVWLFTVLLAATIAAAVLTTETWRSGKTSRTGEVEWLQWLESLSVEGDAKS